MALPLPAQDSELVTLARRGREDAFGALYERYFDGVYDFLTRLMRDRQEAADVAQDTFIKAFERLGHLEKPESFKSWLFTIAHRNGLNRIARSKRAVAVGDFYVSDREIGEFGVIDADREADPERSAEARAAATIIWEAAAGLDPRTYSVMDLHVRQGLDSAEIAEVLGVSKGNAYTMVSRMKKSFSATLATYLLVRRGSQDCAVLGAIVAAETSTGLTPELRRSVDRHAKGCEVCQENRKVLFMPLKVFAALGAVPATAGVKTAIWAGVKAAAIGATSGGAAKADLEQPSSLSAGVGSGAWLRSNVGGLSLAAVLIALLFVGGAFLLNDRDDRAATEVLSAGATNSPSTTLPPPTPATTSATVATTPAPTSTSSPASTAVPASTAAPTTLAPPVVATTTTPPPTTVPPITRLVVRDDSVTITEDVAALVDVLANDSGVAPGSVPQVVSAPQHGAAQPSGRAIRYEPAADYSGEDSFSYSVRGRDGSTKTANVTITIAGVNDAPVVPGPGELAMDEDDTVSFDPLAGAADADGDDLVMTSFDETTEGGGSVTSGSLIYMPAPNWSGTDRFRYWVSDGTFEVEVAVRVVVAPVNDPPSGPAPVLAGDEDATITGNLLTGWSDVEGDEIFIDDPGQRDTRRGGQADVAADGSVSYTPPANFAGDDDFEVRVSDGTDSFEVTVAITVGATNDPPEVTVPVLSAAEDTAIGTVLGRVTATDAEGDDVEFEALSVSAFTIENDGTLRLTASLDFEASSSHSLQASAVDERGASTDFAVGLTVIDVDEGPIVLPATFTVSTGDPAGTMVGRVSASDPEGAPLTFSLQGGAGLIAIDASTGDVQLVVDADPADFPFSAIAIAKDPAGNSGGAAITLELKDVDGPVITNFRSDVDAFFEPPPEGGVCPNRPRFATFHADVTDRSGVRGADIAWHIDVGGLVSSGVVKMALVDDDYEANLSAPPGVLWNRDPTAIYAKVVARDVFGNLSESAEIALTVMPCNVD